MEYQEEFEFVIGELRRMLNKGFYGSVEIKFRGGCPYMADIKQSISIEKEVEEKRVKKMQEEVKS